LNLSTEINWNYSAVSGFQEVCGHLACGIALLSQSGAVLFVNQVMRGLFGDGIVCQEARLYASMADEQRYLDLLIKRVATDASGYVKLRRPSGKPDLLVRVVQLPSYDLQRIDAPSALDILVFVYTADVMVPDISPPLRELGLTAAEARLAQRVASGESPKEAARALGIAVGSARFVLKVIFEKFELHSQSQLASTLAKISLLVSREQL
jgi:DNA-binding CsgD family transcriptional regulator